MSTGRLFNQNNTLTTIFWFSILSFLQPAINVLLLPLYLIKLSPEDFGILTMVGLISGLLSIIIGLKLDMAVRTFYFDYYQDEVKLKEYLAQIFTLVLLSSIIAYSVLLYAGPYLFNLVFKSDKITFYPYGSIALASVLMNLCCSIYFIYLKNKVYIKKFMLYSITAMVITVCTQAYLILILDMKIMGVLWGSFVSSLCVFLLVIINNSQLITFTIPYDNLKPSLLFALPLIPFSFLFFLENRIDNFALEYFMSLEEVGIYGILISIVGLCKLVLGAVDNGIRPYLYSLLKRNVKSENHTFNSLRLLYIDIGLLSMSGVIAIGLNLNLFTDNPKYLEIEKYVVAASIAMIPFILYRFLGLILVYHKKSIDLSKVAFVKVLIVGLLLFIFIPLYGIYGAILAVGLSHILNFFIFRGLVSKMSSFPLLYRKHFERIAIFFLVVIGGYYLLGNEFLGIFGIVQFIIVSAVYCFLDWKQIIALTKLDLSS